MSDAPSRGRQWASEPVAVAQLAEDNVCLAGGADWPGRLVLRLSVTSGQLTEANIDRLAGAIVSAWRQVRPEPAAQQEPQIL